MNEPKLCYVDGKWAYFTTQELKDQWGDDWDDAPYEYNAGLPYEYNPEHDTDKEPWTITKVVWDGDFVPPSYLHNNSPYCVRDINKGECPWLRAGWSDHLVRIYAGVTLDEFCGLINSTGGSVYKEMSL